MIKLKLPSKIIRTLTTHPTFLTVLTNTLKTHTNNLLKDYGWNDLHSAYLLNANNKYLIQTKLGTAISYVFNNFNRLWKLNASGFLDTPEGQDLLKKYEKSLYLETSKQEFKKLLDDVVAVYIYDYANASSSAGVQGVTAPVIDAGKIENTQEFIDNYAINFYLWLEEYYNLVINNYLSVLQSASFIKSWKSSTLRALNPQIANTELKQVKILNEFEEQSFYADVFKVFVKHLDNVLNEFLITNEVKEYRDFSSIQENPKEQFATNEDNSQKSTQNDNDVIVPVYKEKEHKLN